jgi:hypothetical protein
MSSPADRGPRSCIRSVQPVQHDGAGFIRGAWRSWRFPASRAGPRLGQRWRAPPLEAVSRRRAACAPPFPQPGMVANPAGPPRGTAARSSADRGRSAVLIEQRTPDAAPIAAASAAAGVVRPARAPGRGRELTWQRGRPPDTVASSAGEASHNRLRRSRRKELGARRRLPCNSLYWSNMMHDRVVLDI